MPPIKKKYIHFRLGFPYFIKQESAEFLIKSNQLPVSDIWSLWHYIIHTEKKKFGSRFNLEFLESLLEQAEYFYEAATKAPVKSQPLLYYYSFLNLTKAYLNIEVPTLKDNLDFYHGIESCPISATTSLDSAYVEIRCLLANPAIINTVSVAYHLSQRLKDNYRRLLPSPHGHDNGPWKFNVKSLLMSCIGIHRTVSQTYHTQEDFVRVENPELWKIGRSLNWKGEIYASKQQINQLINAGYNINPSNGVDYWQESIPLTSENVPKRDLISMNDLLNEKGIWSYCARDGYRFFISPYGLVKDPVDNVYKFQLRTAANNSLRLSSISIIYFLMFFFGSITRYHPYLFEKVLSNREIWLVSEFLKTQPKQYLHLLTSKVLSTPVLFSRMP